MNYQISKVLNDEIRHQVINFIPKTVES